MFDHQEQFMYDTFDEYASIMNIPRDHPNYEGYQMIWNMARTPSSLLGERDE